MPLSMRRQTSMQKNGQQLRIEQAASRRKAVDLLTKGWKVCDVSRMTKVSKSTVSRLRKHILSKDNDALAYLMSTDIRPGRRPVISEDEAAIINGRLKLAAQRGFAVDLDSLKYILSRVASDGRKGWTDGLPSDDAIRSYRARYRDIVYKKIENNECAKLAAECFEHVESFFSTVQRVADMHKGILQDPDRVLNIDETSVDCTEGKLQRAFTAAGKRSGGKRGIKSTYGVSKHITAVIGASAAALLTPPFLIVAGKRLNSDWWGPVQGNFKETPHGIIARFVKEGWFPGEGVIAVSENGSMEGPLLATFVQHLNHFARKKVDMSQSLLLSLDGHASRKDVAWLEHCVSKNIEAVVNAANTSHFLQPCDQRINKRFQELMRELRDEFCRQGRVHTTRVNFNIACAVYAWDNLTTADVTASFRVTGLFPFQRNFAHQFKTSEERDVDAIKRETDRLERAGIASRISSVRKRRSDNHTVQCVQDVLKKKQGASHILKELYDILNRAETVQKILTESVPVSQSEVTATTAVSGNQRVLYDAGAPATWVTHAELLRKRKERLEQKAHERAAKEKEREERKLSKEAHRQVAARKRAVREIERFERKENAKRKRIVQVRANELRERNKLVASCANALGRKVSEESRAIARSHDQSVRGCYGNRRKKCRHTISACVFAARLVLEVVKSAMDPILDLNRVAFPSQD